MTVQTRALDAGDRAEWDPLWQGYLDFYKTSLTADVTDQTWQRLLDPDEDMYCLVAEDENGRMIGIVHYLYHRVT